VKADLHCIVSDLERISKMSTLPPPGKISADAHASHVFLYCVKSSLQKIRLIKLSTRARSSQSHTNNGFFKLVKALLQIYSCFFSRSIKLYVAYRYQQCHCLPTLPAKMSVFNSRMQDSHSVILNKPRLHTEEPIFIQ